MDQFVTTYRKDFLWPYVRTFGIRPDQGSLGGGNFDHGDMCACQCRQDAGDVGKVLGPNVYEKESFQQAGPNAPLMDPKLYPSRVGPAPGNETQRFNQPNIFLEKLRMKYPFLYEVLRTAAPDDIITRINRDRLRTTYQVDYCHLNEYPSAPYDELLRAAGVAGGSPCSEPVRLPGDPCRQRDKPIGFRPKVKVESIGFGEAKCGGSGGFGGGAQGPGGGIVSMGSTEYQDAISKLGEMIIRNKMHVGRNKTKC